MFLIFIKHRYLWTLVVI